MRLGILSHCALHYQDSLHWRRMICELLSKFLAPIRTCSVDTELRDGDDDAQ